MTDASRKFKLIAVGVLVGALLGVAAFELYQATSTTWYKARVGYRTYPSDDDALTQWLRAQPGVTDGSVVREGGTVVISYGVRTRTRGPSPGPSLGAILDAAERLGYKDRGLLECWVEETH